jgi:hypothetical protein
MKKRISRIVLFVGMICTMITAFFSFSWANPRKLPIESLPVMSGPSADLWPLSHAYSWRIDPVKSKQYVGFGVRTTQRKLAEGESASFPEINSLPPEGEDRTAGWTVTGEEPMEGVLTCQIIDLNELSLATDTPNKPLRLFARLRIGGGSIQSLSREKSILKGENVGAIKPLRDPRWIGDKLLLLVVYTEDKDTLYAHHLFVQQTDKP